MDKPLHVYFIWGVITHLCLNFHVGFTKLLFKLDHVWLITSDCFLWIQLRIQAVINMLVLIALSKKAPVVFNHINDVLFHSILFSTAEVYF